MRRREPVRPAVVDDEIIPECLLVGACLEVWDPQTGSAIVAWRRHRAAVSMWREEQGIGPWEDERVPMSLRSTGAPWSFDFLAAQPDRLQQGLRRLGLPPDWSPTPAPDHWTRPFTPRPIPTPTPTPTTRRTT